VSWLVAPFTGMGVDPEFGVELAETGLFSLSY
jgi:hypothetical protein